MAAMKAGFDGTTFECLDVKGRAEIERAKAPRARTARGPCTKSTAASPLLELQLPSHLPSTSRPLAYPTGQTHHPGRYGLCIHRDFWS
jgi:hypothetical protein